MKTCTKCCQQKPYSDFSKDSQKKDSFCSHCKACRTAYEHSYFLANHEKISVRNNKYSSTHKAEKQQYDKERREKQRDSINKKKREYYHSKGKEVGYIWLINNPDKKRTYAYNRYAIRKQQTAKTPISSKDLNNWLFMQPKICTYCGIECLKSYQIDHIEPLSRQGSHTLDNLTIACPSCNQSKGNKSLIHWLAFRLTN